MRAQRQLQCAGVWLAVSALTSMALPAAATALIDAWRAAQQHDLAFAVSRAAQQSGEARRIQAGALWRSNVMLSATAGVAGSDTAVRGAQFSAPGLGTFDGVAFNTSVNHGTLRRFALSASMPLISRERDAQGKQLVLSADVADLEWQEAQQTLMLTTAQRYFDVVLAADALMVLRQQQTAVDSALAETRDRFRLGDVPVTDTHEAAARAEAITAQGLALETDLQLKHAAFTDATRAGAEQRALDDPRRRVHTGQHSSAGVLGIRSRSPQLPAAHATCRCGGMPCPVRTTVQEAFFRGTRAGLAAGRARCSFDARRQRSKDGPQKLDRSTFAADHQAVAAFQAGNATAGSDVQIVNASSLQLRAAPQVVAVIRIPTIDDHVARVQQGQQITKHLIDDCRGHHQPDRAGLAKLRNHLRQRRRPRRTVLDETSDRRRLLALKRGYLLREAGHRSRSSQRDVQPASALDPDRASVRCRTDGSAQII